MSTFPCVNSDYDTSVGPSEVFTDRLNRLLSEAGLSDAETAGLLGVTEMQVRRLKSGDAKSLKMAGGLRLARRLKVSPWYLAGLSNDPTGSMPAEEEAGYVERVKRLEDAFREQRQLVETLRLSLAEITQAVHKLLPQEKRG